MDVEVDVFISNYTLVDPEIYQLWVDGHTGKKKKIIFRLLLYYKYIFSVSDTVNILNQSGLGLSTGASIELIQSDVLDHFRTYSLVEKYLGNPIKLQEQLSFQIDPGSRKLLIEK